MKKIATARKADRGNHCASVGELPFLPDRASGPMERPAITTLSKYTLIGLAWPNSAGRPW
jgi:hypothetical protein